MINTMKKYENPMLQVVSIKKNDIIVTSGEPQPTSTEYVPGVSNPILAPGLRDVWSEF